MLHSTLQTWKRFNYDNWPTVLAVVVILLIRYKYKERDEGESAERDREQRGARQTKPDIISPTSQGNNYSYLHLTRSDFLHLLNGVQLV